MRKNNPAEMTITEQFEVIKEQMCDEYCRHTVRLENGEIDELYMYEEICEHCPLGRL